MHGGALIEPGAVERFRADLAELIGRPPTGDDRLGLAVSGGADSLAMLLLAAAAYPGGVAAATVDHGLRPEADEEARQVAATCARLGVPHQTLRPSRARGTGSANLQEWARRARYRCLGDWATAAGIAFLATAHQRDDVAEGFLMRAGAGAGLRGLAAMRPSRTLDFGTVTLVRPLLGWTRAELAAVVAGAGLTPVLDPSNDDPAFDRARLRRLLAGEPDLAPAGLARAAEALRDAEEAMEWLVLRELPARLGDDGEGVWLDADGLPFELQRRLTVRAVAGVREAHGLADTWRTRAVAALVRRLARGEGGTVAEVQARPRGSRWHFRLAPPRRSG